MGFRQTEVRGGQLLHNNVPIMVRGVNRHEFDDRSGKALTEGHMLRDVLLMKRSNFNAVRCSHYPNHPRWCVLRTLLRHLLSCKCSCVWCCWLRRLR